MPTLSIMLKPSSARCNLKCSYCFYHDATDTRAKKYTDFMTDGLAGEIIKKAFAYLKGEPLRIVFQGGEPLLSGLDFFENFMLFLRKNNQFNSKVFVAVQTNGTLIDDNWCRFFVENNILVGLSLDGDENANRCRTDPQGRPSFQRVADAAELLKKHGAEFNILCVVTKANGLNIRQTLEFFKGKGIAHIQLIDCLNPFNSEPLKDAKENEAATTNACDNHPSPLPCTVPLAQAAPSAQAALLTQVAPLSADEYLMFMKDAFDFYCENFFKRNYISIRTFDNYINLLKGRPAEMCGMNGHCAHQIVIEGDGSLYPCDFYCVDNLCLGNIQETDFEKLLKNRTAIDFIGESIVVKDACKKCSFFKLCKGGCKRYAQSENRCEENKAFFEYALPNMRKIALMTD